MIDRRQFIKSGVACAGVAVSGCSTFGKSSQKVPSYLKGYEQSMRRIRDRQLWPGLKMPNSAFYALWVVLYPRPPRVGTVQRKDSRERVRKTTARFSPDKFDADFITDLALAAGMKYVNLTSKHHEGFCLFDPGRGSGIQWRLPVAIFVRTCEQCRKKGLGCFFYYSLLADWHHPYFYPRKFNWIARPDYKVEPEQL